MHNQKDLVTIINFSVTKSGLEAKLLSSIISHFQPELELQKQELLLRQETLKISLAELEDRVLKELGDSSGDILENKALVHSLNDTKSQSEVVGNSLKESEQLQRVIDQKR